MKSEKIAKVYSCCGQYLAVRESVKTKPVYCPRCGNEQTVELRTPNIVLFTK